MAGSHASAPAPPRPSRHNTLDQSGGGYVSPNSGTNSPAPGGGNQYGTASRSHQSVSAVQQGHYGGTPPMGSSPILDNSEDAYNSNAGSAGGSQSHFVPSARERERGARGGPDGRNTFKSVFGGFVNSMSGE